LETHVFLIRDGVTDWHAEGKVLGHRDIALNDEGQRQAQRAADALAGVAIAEVISSPLVRALQTAEAIGGRFGIEVARDPRLIDFKAGKWEGMTYAEVLAQPEIKQFVRDPSSERIPGADRLRDVSARAVAAVEQALEDNPSGDAVAMVTHAGIIRVLLTHYLGSPPANYHRIHVSPGSVSVLAFASDRQLPRVLAVNWRDRLTEVLRV
jgi:broad specificity phosphatase PhoE